VAAAAEPASSPRPTPGAASLLYPRESPTRSERDLPGLWRFQLDAEYHGEAGGWFERGLPKPRLIPVPCSWNELFDDACGYLRTAWYETDFQLDPGWHGQRICLRFGSAVYRARVWLNGEYLGVHVGVTCPCVRRHDACAPRRVQPADSQHREQAPARPGPLGSRPQDGADV
jgi:beta-glucuronidase